MLRLGAHEIAWAASFGHKINRPLLAAPVSRRTGVNGTRLTALSPAPIPRKCHKTPETECTGSKGGEGPQKRL